MVKKKTQPVSYMASIRASVQLRSDGLHIAVVIPWKKLERVGVPLGEVKKKYRKGSKKS